MAYAFTRLLPQDPTWQHLITAPLFPAQWVGAWSLLLSRYSGETDVTLGIAQCGGIRPLTLSVHLTTPAQTWWTQIHTELATTARGDRHWLQSPDPLGATVLVLSQREGFTPYCSEPALWVVTTPEGINIHFDPDRITADCVQRLGANFQVILRALVAEPTSPLAALPTMTSTEWATLQTWAVNRRDYPREQSIDGLFQVQVARVGEQVAVIYPHPQGQGHQSLTYRELHHRAQRLAILLQRRGVQRGTFVAMFMERSLELIVAILGIIKAGGVYVPIDPAYPVERIDWMLADTASPVILTQTPLLPKLSSHPAQLICLDPGWSGQEVEGEFNPIALTPTDVAYVNYTSGSTGKPKGVMVPHRGVVRLICGSRFTPLDGSQTLLHLAPTAFDLATLEIWGALLKGGRCVLYPGSGIPDPMILGRVLREFSVTTMWLTSGLFNTLIAEAPHCLQGVPEILVGGEALSVAHIRLGQKLLPDTQFVNGYGPTENTTFTCCYRIPRPLPAHWTSIPIGRPVENTDVYVLDEQGQPVPLGAVGELYTGGDGMALGYLNRPEITAERFIPHPFSADPTAKVYKTGDQVRYLPNGLLEFLGRRDTQVKIRGWRIELGEIETVLGNWCANADHPALKDVVVLCREDHPGNKLLVAYVVPVDAAAFNAESLKTDLRKHLPEYMIPNEIIVMAQIPLNPNGKVDRRALPAPTIAPPVPVLPTHGIEQELVALWCEVLGRSPVGVEDNFFDLGGTSLAGLKLIARIQNRFGSNLAAAKLYQYRTIRAMARYLAAAADPEPLEAAQRPTPTAMGIAIVAMAGRLPGAQTVAQLWENLCGGVESITFFNPEELDASIDPELRSDASYVKAKGMIEGAETFDAAFFGISPREAEIMDPQARVFLELAYEALEGAGYSDESFPGLIGLYAGSGQNTYFENHICGRRDVVGRLGSFQTMLANEKDFLTTRTSFKLNLTGPSLSINTACSTSLVAIIQAYYGLVSGQCDLALAGGISINCPQNQGYLYQEGGMLSPDGHCRPFDAQAQGTLFNNGGAVVVLRRLEEAIAAGDQIYGVIKGVGLNNDGCDKASFTAPSINGQMSAILQAQAMAQVEPETISYIEAHGTATPLGDPIEIEALTQAFRTKTEAKQFCGIGSIKSNVGHLVAAAGGAGLIKTALALYHRQIPPTLHFTQPNPHIDFAHSPFYVQDRLQPWPAGTTPRRAGVSSFGVGGTNAHVIVEEPPPLPPSSPARPYVTLCFSAKTATALEAQTARLKTYLTENPEVNLGDVAFTLQGRKRFAHRRFVVAPTVAAAVENLTTLPPNVSGDRHTQAQRPDLVFMFPGQGSQYVKMGRNLYDREPIFRQTLDICAEILRPHLDRDIREILYPNPERLGESTTLLRQTLYTQPALFIVEYALAKLWQSWGLQPQAMIGHSIGEFVAASLAQVFSLEDALLLIATRGKLMGDLPGGAMLSVRLSEAEVTKRLRPGVALAAINGPALCVVSGPTPAVAQLQQALAAEGVMCKPLHTSHAFHSPMMDPVLAPFTALVAGITLNPPQLPIVSTTTTQWLTPAQATDPQYWARHLREPVRFAEGVQTLWNHDPRLVLLEVGPRTTATTLARQQMRDRRQNIAIPSLGSSAEDEQEWLAMAQAIGQLELAGIALNGTEFYDQERRQRLPLPTYPFERQRFWIEPQPAAGPARPQAITAASGLNAAQPFNAPPISLPTMITATTSRTTRLIPIIADILANTAGIAVDPEDQQVTFLDLGFDSLSLTQVALALKKKFKVKVTFRQLLETYPNLQTLAGFIETSLPPAALPAPEAPRPPNPAPPMADVPFPTFAIDSQTSNGITALVQQQLQIMAKQMELLSHSGLTVPTVAPPHNGYHKLQATEPTPTAANPPAVQKGPAPGTKINKVKEHHLTPEQGAAIAQIVAKCATRTPESKRQAQRHRPYLADPRTVSGFTPLIKEMVYPLVVARSAGSKLWDIDGNEYVDVTNGFGINFFGWSPDFVMDAVRAQMEKGIEIGPQCPLAGKVARMVAEFTGMERVAFCNTGSEAVMAALRIARTVTGRDLVVIFDSAYHGTFDEVLAHQGPNRTTVPAAPGIMPSVFEHVLVLDYGAPESLAIIRERAEEIAAVMVEPVQSRRPNLQPRAFLQELRNITAQSGTAFIFDEVVTGFRAAPGGAQEYFGIRADIATYGKVVGGGLPIGVLAGKGEYLDALDGGFWQFGDDSMPEVGVTFFAGTFVRHPMALAAAEAVLTKLKEGGPELQRSLADKVSQFAHHLKDYFAQVGAPIEIAHFTSLFYVTYAPEETHGNLLFYLLREKGVHIWEYRPCFFTLAHSDEDIEKITWAFKTTVAELQAAGLLSSNENAAVVNRNLPPRPGARLGKDQEGNPAWFMRDPERPGKHLQLTAVSPQYHRG